MRKSKLHGRRRLHAGRSKVLMPSEGYEGVVKFVFENISTLAVNACPPVLVGVGIATSVETAAVLSRKPFCARLAAATPIESGRAGATHGRRTQPFGDWSTRADWQQFGDGRAYRICRSPSVNHRRCCFYRLLGASSRHTLRVHADLTFENLSHTRSAL